MLVKVFNAHTHVVKHSRIHHFSHLLVQFCHLGWVYIFGHVPSFKTTIPWVIHLKLMIKQHFHWIVLTSIWCKTINMCIWMNNKQKLNLWISLWCLPSSWPSVQTLCTVWATPVHPWLPLQIHGPLVGFDWAAYWRAWHHLCYQVLS